MAQTTRTSRIAARRAPTGRFARASAARTGRSARPAGRIPRLPARRPPKRTGLARVTSLLASGPTPKLTGGSRTGKLGGLAALTAAAGVAFRNRDKLAGRLGHRDAPTQPPPTS